MDRLQKRQSGFTIVEIMIVLVVAGLIMLIVFLAVPALQRSARNNGRKSDVAAITEAMATFINDNNGLFPDTIRNDSINSVIVDFGNTNNLTSYYTATLSYYNNFTTSDTSWGHDADNIYITEWPVTTLLTPTVLPVSQTNIANCQKDAINAAAVCRLTTETAAVVTGENCNATYNGPGQVNNGSFAVFYVVETGSGNGDLECVSQ